MGGEQRGRADEQFRTSFLRSPVALSSIFPLKSASIGRTGPLSLQRPPARSRGHGNVSSAQALAGAAGRLLLPLRWLPPSQGSHPVVWLCGKPGLTRKTKQTKQTKQNLVPCPLVDKMQRRGINLSLLLPRVDMCSGDSLVTLSPSSPAAPVRGRRKKKSRRLSQDNAQAA